MCFNPLVSLPDANFTREALSKLEYFGVIDFFLSETAHHADVVLPGSLHEEEDGLGCSAEGRVIHWRRSVDPPGRRLNVILHYLRQPHRLFATFLQQIISCLIHFTTDGPRDVVHIFCEVNGVLVLLGFGAVRCAGFRLLSWAPSSGCLG
jgi:anaerobic selenocysteine-containing dehydrogenase